jgi:hypothetical protein
MEKLNGFFFWCVCHLLSLAVRDILPQRKPGQEVASMSRACVLMYLTKEVRGFWLRGFWIDAWAAWGVPYVDKRRPLLLRRCRS